MKTILVLAAALGFSVSAASAECVGHTASVDKETTTASVSKDTSSGQARPVKKDVPQESE
ncbi:hypothetical protein [Phyllobacterium sp. SB3]|uniref:hypothetical protein n=1 Tax=Phyllobacterium sp. SB3 TaxID=3156073 RepID=UPI0032AFE31E